jgi:hypothetical protein
MVEKVTENDGGMSVGMRYIADILNNKNFIDSQTDRYDINNTNKLEIVQIKIVRSD